MPARLRSFESARPRTAELRTGQGMQFHWEVEISDQMRGFGRLDDFFKHDPAP